MLADKTAILYPFVVSSSECSEEFTSNQYNPAGAVSSKKENNIYGTNVMACRRQVSTIFSYDF
jgi:hypothetical protein